MLTLVIKRAPQVSDWIQQGCDFVFGQFPLINLTPSFFRLMEFDNYL